MTTAIVPEGESVPGQAPTELSPVESPEHLVCRCSCCFHSAEHEIGENHVLHRDRDHPVGVALLFAAIGGLLLAGLVASLRIWQLHHRLTQGAK